MVLYFRVLEPNKAIREVESYLFATSQLAQVTLRSVCGQAELDELLAERDRINARITLLEKSFQQKIGGLQEENKILRDMMMGINSGLPAVSVPCSEVPVAWCG